MTRRRLPLAAQIDLLIERAKACGLSVEAVEITVDGVPRVLTRRPSQGVGIANDDGDWVDLAGQTQDLGRA